MLTFEQLKPGPLQSDALKFRKEVDHESSWAERLYNRGWESGTQQRLDEGGKP